MPARRPLTDPHSSKVGWEPRHRTPAGPPAIRSSGHGATLVPVDDLRAMAGVSDPLGLWDLFPVAEVPRPLVLVGDTVRERGDFDSGAAKLAYLDGAIDNVEVMPSALYESMCPHRRPRRSARRLSVIAVRSVDAPFLTDRGDQDLAAWEVTLSHFDGVVTVLDPATRAQAWHPEGWSSTTPPGPAVTAGLHEDGGTLTLRFVGTPRAYADYPAAEVRESSTAVLVVPVAVDHPGVSGARLAYGERREVIAVLAQPLGSRVLVRQDGYPVPVTPDA